MLAGKESQHRRRRCLPNDRAADRYPNARLYRKDNGKETGSRLLPHAAVVDWVISTKLRR